VNLPQASIIDQIADHRDELLNENRHLKQRIKRLEEAGDAVMKSLSCGCPHGPSVFHCQTCTNSWEAWTKAKEAKP
jgi:hypothetical protein